MVSFSVTQGAQPGALWQPRRVRWVGNGREVWEGGHMCILMADLHGWMAKTNTAL